METPDNLGSMLRFQAPSKLFIRSDPEQHPLNYAVWGYSVLKNTFLLPVETSRVLSGSEIFSDGDKVGILFYKEYALLVTGLQLFRIRDGYIRKLIWNSVWISV
jgi:hypothetical protein